ncbi:MAG: hypothetical protein GIX03_08765 [Candidatus Eremiobacteraeota bacterium]|nr:hypothetical protein [Candidatus Eremiobacteraeota bacterium]MBC5803072.1 hypothetical protein [Candidatus Eremiobacteraeota bacterium]MBC5823105.1 hypothetical protein [Candidatus Eremiobacteraeota bacterium]
MVKHIIMLSALLGVTLLTNAEAAPTPVPGGANAISALSGKIGQTVFNGNLRIKIIELREATEADSHGIAYPPTPTADQKVMFMRVLLSNGTHDVWFGIVHYTLADKDAISVEIPTNSVEKPSLRILQGAAARQRALFVVDKDFVPTKLIVDCAGCAANAGFRPIRFTIASP